MAGPEVIIAGLRRERQLEAKRQDCRNERQHRTLYMQHWRQQNREHYNQYMRVYKFQRRRANTTTVVEKES